MASELGATPSKDGLLVSTTRVAGLDAVVGYRFSDDKLSSVVVLFTAEYSNSATYLSKHLELRELLTKKYGSPTRVGDVWSGDELYRDRPGDWGKAVETGRMHRLSLWRTPSGTIGLITDGENYKQKTRILYESTALGAEVEKAATQEKLDTL